MQSLLLSLAPQIIAFRQDIHRHPELAWLEYRTTSKIAEIFENLGYEVNMGHKAIAPHARLTPPSPTTCAREEARAIIEGAKPEHIALMQQDGGGLTGLWFDIHLGHKTTCEKPIIAFRFDIDANEVQEEMLEKHLPAKKHFSSQHQGIMHACGHDGHAAIGVGLGLMLHHMQAELENAPEALTVRLVFQPAEEIGQGAKAMLEAGAMNNVVEVYGLHLGIQAQKEGTLIAGTTHFLANTSFEVNFIGTPAHSGLAPHEGNNALLAAATAVQGMHAIPRHGKGQSRINIGELHCTGASNVIPANAWLAGETRGIDAEINAWMTANAKRICQGASSMWNCSHTFTVMGNCVNGFSDVSLAQEVLQVAKKMPCFDTLIEQDKFWASEDFTWFLQDVQAHGGRGTYIQLGVCIKGGHHTACFDFDEEALMRGVELLTRIVLNKCAKGQ